uniref:Uncharacterized protein n=1 Tax=Timema shepardi TaxID=629360 RepID=A0A7R9G6X8_TIMSH|nr:unnamed protein product [Timema shepardi]
MLALPVQSAGAIFLDAWAFPGNINSQGRTELHYLRQLLEKCDLCSGVRRESCQSNPPPCFQGVACQDTREGVRCGHCPRGYVGDGRTCTPGTTCEEKPCFPGVQCYDTVEGFRCGSCPAGLVGDGRQCKAPRGCDSNPCHRGCTITPAILAKCWKRENTMSKQLTLLKEKRLRKRNKHFPCGALCDNSGRPKIVWPAVELRAITLGDQGLCGLQWSFVR